MRTFPKLHKLTTSEKVEEWEIWVEGNVIHKRYGLSDGKKQHVTDVVKVGTNLGRANERSPEEQAEFEAEALWKRKREGLYRENVADLQKGEKTSEAGGYTCMLAHNYKDHKEKLAWNCYCQRKYDGLRCIARCLSKEISLWFRSGKRIVGMQHIVKALEKAMGTETEWILDGELYCHGAEFNEMAGVIRKDKNLDPIKEAKIEFHVYDYPKITDQKGNLWTETTPYCIRKGAFTEKDIKPPLIRVETEIVNSEEEMLKKHDQYVEEGYEGIILRNVNAIYQQKRSYDLLKYKQFEDKEFEIIGWELGRGTLAEAVGAFTVKLDNGKECRVKMKGENVTELLKKYAKDPKLFMHKLLTTQFQGYNSKGSLRFPVGKAIREDY